MIIEHFLSWMDSAPVPKRAQAVSALSRAYLYSDMSFEDRITAESAMTVLLEDPSSTVRFAMADVLASSKNAPRHIILGLASDNKEIATMILSRSPIFSEGELVDLVATGNVEQQIAIACRGNISTALCGAIAEVGVVEACLGLLMNKAARYSKKIVRRIAERHGANPEIRQILLGDNNLDADIRVLLLAKLGSELESFITSKRWLGHSRAKQTVREALDRSSILCAANSSDAQVEQLIVALIEAGRLTTGYLLRAICMGNITLFCKSLSKLSSIPSARIEAMISQKRHSAFRASFIKSGMPVQAFEVFSTAINVWQGLLSEPEWISRARMPYLVTRQLLGKYNGQTDKVVDELLLLLQKISADLAREEARTHVLELTRKKSAADAAKCSEQMREIHAPNAMALTDAEEAVFETEFAHEMEQSIAKALEQDIIDISENDIELPQDIANDINVVEVSKTDAPGLETSLLENAA